MATATKNTAAPSESFKGVTPEKAKKIKHLVTLTDAAHMLGISRQAVHNRAQAGKFASTALVGDERSLIVFERDEVRAMAKADKAAAKKAEREAAKKAKAKKA